MSELNWAIGTEAEDRIKAILSQIPEFTIRENSGRYPDFFLEAEYQTFAIEAKSILAFHAGGFAGSCKLSRQEHNEMIRQDLSGINPMLVVEIRPRTNPIYSYRVIPLQILYQEVAKRSCADQVTLTLHWVNKYGIDLRSWIYVLQHFRTDLARVIKWE